VRREFSLNPRANISDQPDRPGLQSGARAGRRPGCGLETLVRSM